MRGLVDAVAIVWGAARRFGRHDGANLAAAVSFYATLSLVPLLLLVVALGGVVLGRHEGIFDRVMDLADDFVPDLSEELVGTLRGLSTHAGAVGWAGLAGLLWAVHQMFSALERAITILFERPNPRGFLRSKVVAFAAAFAIGGLFVASVFLSGALGVMGHQGGGAARWLRLSLIVGFAVEAGSFTAVLRFFPAGGARWGDALWGGGTCAVLFEAAKRGFVWYLNNVGHINLLYGSMGALVIVLVWIYCSALLLVFSAGIAAEREARRSAGRD